jgi:natural product precursor
MKKKINKRLNLNKNTVAHLGNEDMSALNGGGDFTILTCYSYCTFCTDLESFCLPCDMTLYCSLPPDCK